MANHLVVTASAIGYSTANASTGSSIGLFAQSVTIKLEYLLKEYRCVFVVLLMVIYWLTEALPLAVTSLLPIFMFPLLGIMSTKQVAKAYMNVSLIFCILFGYLNKF